jgi:hypothetical protein
MKKIKLDLDDLKVESFDTLPEHEGEVFGYQCPTYPGCPTCDSTCPSTCSTCAGQNTCGSTCAFTCGWTCADTCPPRQCNETNGPTCPV